MKISKVLRKATVYLDPAKQYNPYHKLSKGCCAAISFAQNSDYLNTETHKYFAYLFNPYNGYDFWWSDRDPDSMNQRFMALLFAAECAESGGL